MKHHLNRALSVVALLMLSLSTWASGEVTISVEPANAGTVTSDISNGVCTLTATPAQGYYLTAANLQAVTILNGEAMQAPRRAIPIHDGALAISATNADADPSGVTTYTFTMPDDNFTVEVTAEFQRRISISDATITLAESSCTYDGTAKEPAVSQVMVGNTTLTADDYTVSYSNNINIGTSATVTLTGQGMYLGTATTTFTISAKAITSDMITLSSYSLVYTAEANIPEVTVIDQIGGENVRLSAETDYTVSYQQVVGETASAIDDPTDVGNYNVVVTGLGNYTGSATKSFAITKAPLKGLSVSLQGWTYGAQASVPVVEGNEGEAAETFYYKTKDADDETYTTVVPENAGNYTIKVQVAESANYASGSATADFTISKAVLTGATVTLAGWTYGATANEPEVQSPGNGMATFTYKGADEEDTKYTETVPVNAGNYTVKATIAETANYQSGTATADFSIAKADLSMVTETHGDLTYNGSAQQLVTISNLPDRTAVRYYYSEIGADQEALCEPSDEMFTATVPTATNAGHYGILYKVDGGNNYNDKLAGQTIKVEIVPAAITEVTLVSNSLTYTGEVQEPTIASVKAGELVLTANDYDISYEMVEGQESSPVDAPVEAGTYNVVVTGQGNFEDIKFAQFDIVYQTLDLSTVTFPQGQKWTTYYNSGNMQTLPDGQNVGAFVASGVSNNEVTVTQIKYIPKEQVVLLNNATTTTTDNVFGQDVQGNLLVHATDDVDVAEKAGEGDFYGLYNGTFMRVTGTIPAGKNYLMVPNAVVPSGYAPQLTIVIDGEATGVNGVRSKMEDVRGDIYDLQGRKVQKPSKKGLYINNGHKVVVK